MYTTQTDCGVILTCGAIRAGGCLVRDIQNRADRIKRLEFHIERGDYFAVLATIVNIAAKEKDFDSRRIFEKLFEDLEYLQENYTIVKKIKEKHYSPKN